MRDGQTYRLSVEKGDRVRMPDGRLGTVTAWNIRHGGHFMFVWVKPDRSKRLLLRWIPTFTRLYVEEQIDALVPIRA